MAEALFGHGELNEFEPDYAGVNWRAAYEAQLAERGLEPPMPAWFEAQDELGELVEQLTQESCCIYLNKTNRNLDVISVLDPRDGNAIWFSRQQLSDGVFDEIVADHGEECMVVSTKYPLQMVAEYVLAFAQVDIQQIDTKGLPEGFNEIS